MSLHKTIKDIASLKIQGAEAVASAAVKAIGEAAHTARTEDPKEFLKNIIEAKKKLSATRPTEPYLRNSMDSVFMQIHTRKDLRKLREEVFAGVQSTLKHMESARKSLVEIGAEKIKNGMIIYTHCHSSTVTQILIRAKKMGKRFEVHNTETRPRLQGRKTAKELAKAGIKVRHYVDSGARLALKKADIMLIGADAITSEGKVINKIGSEMFAIVAEKLGVPVYCCTNSWKFDPKTIFGFTEEIEERPGQEVWKSPRRG